MNPGPVAHYPHGATQFQIQTVNAIHTTNTRLFKQYDATDRALKQQLLGCVNNMFVNALSDTHVGYANVSTLDLLTHLYTAYAKIMDGDLEENKETMGAAYDVNLPIEKLFKRIEDGVQFAAVGNTPFTAAQVVSIAFCIIQNIGMFTDDCKIWKRLPAIQKTWAQLKIDFSLAHSKLHKSQQYNRTGGYENNATEVQEMQEMRQETAMAIANLASATLADRETMTSIQATITTLTLQLAEVNIKLADSLNVVTTLNEQLFAVTGAAKGGGGNGGGGWTPTSIGTTPPMYYTHYCWTHGIKSEHTSAQCTKPTEGHKTEAHRFQKDEWAHH